MQSDYGGEFKTFTTYLTKLDITRWLTCPYSIHQNGTMERKHLHIVEMGLTMLSRAYMSLHIWDHSFFTTIHVINKLPSTGAPKFQSPYHALYHKLLNYDSLKVFNCAWFPHCPITSTNLILEVRNVYS